MSKNPKNKTQSIQEEEYSFPYHYIPEISEKGFTQVKHWSWGYRYLGGLRVVIDQLNKISFNSLLDVGCGDGRFLRELHQLYPGKFFVGLDYSARAINLAKAFNPQLDYRCMNILEEKFVEKFDIVTAIEVLEHIPKNELDTFIDRIIASLKPNSTFILTVPHKNVPLTDKHFQHFTSDSLKELLSNKFSKISFIPFDPNSRFFDNFVRITGSKGNYFIITYKKLLTYCFKLYINKYLYSNKESRCKRICAVCIT